MKFRIPNQVSFRFPRGAFQLAGIGLALLLSGCGRQDDSERVGSAGLDSRSEERSAEMLLDPKEVRDRLGDLNLRILDTRPMEDYREGHIPGAIPVRARSWQELGLSEGGLHDAGAWGEKVGEVGIANGNAVVVYGASLPDTARIWWTLKYLGVEEVAILDGGWEAWEESGLPVERGEAPLARANFVPEFQPDRLSEIGELREALDSPGVKVVDARSAAEFEGTQVLGARGGHIPGASHLEWKELLREDGRFKSPEALRALFRSRGIHPEQTAITC